MHNSGERDSSSPFFNAVQEDDQEVPQWDIDTQSGKGESSSIRKRNSNLSKAIEKFRPISFQNGGFAQGETNDVNFAEISLQNSHESIKKYSDFNSSAKGITENGRTLLQNQKQSQCEKFMNNVLENIQQQTYEHQMNSCSTEMKQANLTKTNDETANNQNVFTTFAHSDEVASLPFLHATSDVFHIKDYIDDVVNFQTQNQGKDKRSIIINRSQSYQSNFYNYQIDQNIVQVKIQKEREYTSNVQEIKAQIIPEKFQSQYLQPNLQLNEPVVDMLKSKGKTMEAECRMKVSKNKWKYVIFKINQNEFIVDNFPLSLKSIQKIKIYPIGSYLPKHSTLKISVKNVTKDSSQQQLFLSVNKMSKWADLPLPYQSFVKIIIKKLKNFGIRSPTEWETPAKRPRNFTTVILNSSPSKRKQKQQRSRSKSIEEMKADNPFKNSVSAQRLATVFIHGKVYKKSYFLGNWQKRYTVVNQMGIFSYRNQQDETPSISIERKNIKYMWSWFSILEQQKILKNKSFRKNQFQIHDQIKATQYTQKQFLQRSLFNQVQNEQNRNKNYLIVKIKHGLSDQTEFAIPICNFDTTSSNNKNWLLAFYRVMPNLDKATK